MGFTWTAEKTWSVGELAKAADLNTYLRDDMNAVNDVIYLRPQEFTIYAGSPVIAQDATNSYVPGWLFDQTTQEAVTTSAMVPQGWLTADVAIWWSVQSGAGNVRWGTDISTLGNGSGTTGAVGATQATATGPTAGVAKRSVIQSGAGVTAGNLCKVQIVRVAADGADTLAADACVFGLEIRRVS